MSYCAVVFFVVAVVAAAFGFAGIAQGAEGPGRVLFVVFLILSGVCLMVGPRTIALPPGDDY